MAQHCRWMWLAPWIPAPPLSHPCPFLVPDLGDGCAWVIRGHRCSDGAASLPQYSRRVQGCRFELLCLHRTAGRGRKEGTHGADVLRINPCHLLLRLAAKKKKNLNASASPTPRHSHTQSVHPGEEGPPRSSSQGQRPWRNPGLIYSGHRNNYGN